MPDQPQSPAETTIRAQNYKYCMIRTTEQLDALPIGAVVRELEHPVAPGVFELQGTDGNDETHWYIAGDGRPVEPQLPVLLLWTPTSKEETAARV